MGMTMVHRIAEVPMTEPTSDPAARAEIKDISQT